MKEPSWLTLEDVLRVHKIIVEVMGESQEIRYIELLDSAVHRPQNLFRYASPDLADLAASYANAIAKNHAFVNGNKRTSFVAAVLFLEDNGFRMPAEKESEQEQLIDGLASGESTPEELAKYFRENMEIEILHEFNQWLDKSSPQNGKETLELERDIEVDRDSSER